MLLQKYIEEKSESKVTSTCVEKEFSKNKSFQNRKVKYPNKKPNKNGNEIVNIMHRGLFKNSKKLTQRVKE